MKCCCDNILTDDVFDRVNAAGDAALEEPEDDKRTHLCFFVSGVGIFLGIRQEWR